MTVGELVGGYGAVLSTLILAREVMLRRRRLAVSMMFGVSKERGETCAVIMVTNVAAQPIFLRWVGLAYPLRKTTFVERLRHTLKYRHINPELGWVRIPLPAGEGDWDFPRAIESGQSVEFWVPFTGLRAIGDGKEGLFRATVQDALGRNSYSDPFKAWSVETRAAVLTAE